MGTHHGVGHDHLQAYLDEFTFRFNRRRTPMAAFQAQSGLSDTSPPSPRDSHEVIVADPNFA